MSVLSLLRTTFFPPRQPPTPPTMEELAQAEAVLKANLRPAHFAKLGETPSKSVLAPESYWGGNFFGEPGQSAPRCQESGKEMIPLLQIRTDEFPGHVDALNDVALLCIWYDPDSSYLWEGKNGTGFAIQAHQSFEHLVPIPASTTRRTPHPVLPLSWTGPVDVQPELEDIEDQIPENAAADPEIWCFESEYLRNTAELRQTHPVMVGGYPQWIQGPQSPEGSQFEFQICSNHPGKLNFGDGGSFYFFRSNGEWIFFADCF